MPVVGAAAELVHVVQQEQAVLVVAEMVVTIIQ
jgi:hypothetical protein